MVRFSRRPEHGFTLTELLITMAVTGMIVGAIVSSFILQRKSYVRQEQVTVMVQNTRAAMDMMVREVRMAGYGVPPSPLSTWISWVAGFTSNPLITQGSGAEPDTLSIASSFDAATLSVAANQGATILILSSGQGSLFNTTNKKVIYIGRNEYGMITGVAGNTLTIDTNPTVTGLQGLQWSYPVGTPVELLRVITYTVAEQALRRNENTGAGAQPLAENIENLQVTLTGNAVTLSLTGKTTNPDIGYTHPTVGDAYRRVALTSKVTLRNLDL